MLPVTYVEKENLKEEIPFPLLLSLDMDIPADGMVSCPFHPDSTPSFKIYENGGHCFGGCGQFDIYRYVQEKQGLEFVPAYEWLVEHKSDILNQKIHFSEPKKTVVHTPAPVGHVDYFYHSLQPEHREYFKSERLLTDATIDRNKLGWRPDVRAYSIPFWKGKPGNSPVDIIQFRSTDPDSRSKYFGLKGMNHPSILNRHVINPFLVIVLFGTFDSQLAEQDGLPAISTNGSTVFMRPDKPETQQLLEQLKIVKNLLIIPDGSPQEFVPAQALAELAGGQVKMFPFNTEAKDYVEFRKTGWTSKEFIKQVLGNEWFDKVIAAQEQERIVELLCAVAEGNTPKVQHTLQEIQQSSIPFHVVRYATSMLCSVPNRATVKIRPDWWEDVALHISDLDTVNDLQAYLLEQTNERFRRRGGF